MRSLSARTRGTSDDNFRSDLLARLNVLIALLLERSEPESKVSTSGKIVKLTELGVAPSDIARILGKSTNYVTGALAVRRRRKTPSNG